MATMMRIAAAVLLTIAMGGLISSNTTQAQAPAICLTLEPGTYQITVPEVAGNPAGTLTATIGEGGELLTLVEPGGVDLVAIGAIHGLLPLYEPHLPEGIAVTPCAGGFGTMGTGGLLGGGIGAQEVVLVALAALSVSTLSLLTLLARRRGRTLA